MEVVRVNVRIIRPIDSINWRKRVTAARVKGERIKVMRARETMVN